MFSLRRVRGLKQGRGAEGGLVGVLNNWCFQYSFSKDQDVNTLNYSCMEKNVFRKGSPLIAEECKWSEFGLTIPKQKFWLHSNTGLLRTGSKIHSLFLSLEDSFLARCMVTAWYHSHLISNNNHMVSSSSYSLSIYLSHPLSNNEK